MSDQTPFENTQTVDVRDKLVEVDFSAAYWRELGQRLTYIESRPDLEAIEADNSKVEGRFDGVIDFWRRHGDNPCWETLAEAVAKCTHGGSDMQRDLLIKVGIAVPPGKPVITDSDSGQYLPYNTKDVYEEIKEAKKCTYLFAFKLLPIITIQKIRSRDLKSEDRLLKMVEEYMKLLWLKPSWEGIAIALKSKWVDLPEVAKKIEIKYCRGRNVIQEFENLYSEFQGLIIATCEATKATGISVNDLVDIVRAFVRVTRDKDYFMEYADHLRESKSVRSVFDRLRCHWDYLDPEIYGQIIDELSLSNLRPKFEAYEEELASFLDLTLVTDFCKIPRIEEEKDVEPSLMFTECCSNLDLKNMRLRDVEKYRIELANKCNLQSCAVTITRVRRGSVEITMLVPESTDLKNLLSDEEFIRKHSIVRMVFRGMVVYSQDESECGTSVDPIRRVRKSRFRVATKFLLKLAVDTLTKRLRDYWKTPLTVAVERGDLQEVRELIAIGEDPNPHTISTPLKEACSIRNREIAEALLRAGADPNLVTDDYTPLMEASRVGDSDMIELLVQYGADPNTVNGENWTALMAASNNGRSEAADALLQHRADPNRQDHVGWSALLASVHQANVREESGEEYRNYEDIALRLVAAGANPHFQNLECLNAMRLAITNTQERLAYAFLDRHPDLKPGLRGHPELDWTDKYDETDLLYACKMNHVGFVKRILRKGANPNLSNINGESPLFAAIGYANSEMVEDLLVAGADPNMATIGAPPLFQAVQCGNSEVVVNLLQVGANPNVLQDEGTPLVTAVRCGEKRMVKYLLEAGADPNNASYVEQLPLYHAKRMDDEEIIQLLEHYQAKPELEQELPRRMSAQYYTRIATSFFLKGT